MSKSYHQLSNTKCGICKKLISEKLLQDQDDENKKYFHSVCIQCMSTCGQCGQDSGYPLHTDIVFGDCDICNHRGCRSCGITMKCDCCSQVVCVHCIQDTEQKTVCPQIVENLIKIKYFF